MEKNVYKPEMLHPLGKKRYINQKGEANTDTDC